MLQSLAGVGESNANSSLLAKEKSLMLKTAKQRDVALHWMCLDHSESEPFHSPTGHSAIVFPGMNAVPANDNTYWQSAAEPGLSTPDLFLRKNTCLIKENYSIADLAWIGFRQTACETDIRIDFEFGNVHGIEGITTSEKLKSLSNISAPDTREAA